MTKSSNKGQTVGEKYSGIEFLQTPGRTPASGSLLEGTPVLRIPARRNPGSPLRSTPGLVPRTAPFPREKENFRQGESSIFPNMEEFNLLQPTKAHLKKTPCPSFCGTHKDPTQKSPNNSGGERGEALGLSVDGLSSTSSTGVGAAPNHDPIVDAHQRLLGEVFFLCSQVQDMVARRDLLIQQVRASARWELMREWLEKRVDHWDTKEEYRRYLFVSRGINQQSGDFTQAATSKSVVGSRFSEEPSF
ncbi:hypothetical protein F2Q70_00002785 [Brassica cretica]|uniref:Uncharacterized protein n=1 Tax=Brassica cretica TaxID=69181 RepID=A0A8S9IXY9_BRACR|nr:hypothetical protein F2Q70_00002785 [Brassica cretica]